MPSPSRSKQKAPAIQNAIALLKADHRQVEQWFEEFESARSAKRKQDLATNICNALTVHTEIEKSSPADDYFDSTVHVLSEMIKHHVKEEEQPDGMFAEARKSKMDFEELGRELLQRKQELTSRAEAA